MLMLSKKPVSRKHTDELRSTGDHPRIDGPTMNTNLMLLRRDVLRSRGACHAIRMGERWTWNANVRHGWTEANVIRITMARSATAT